jgi:dipeptidase E
LDLQLKGYRDDCDIEHLKLTKLESLLSKNELKASIEAADIIAVSGGNTLFAVSRWRRLGIDGLLRDAWKNGTIVCGGSAGAICWFDGGHSDSLDPSTVLHLKSDLTDEEKAAWNYVRISGLGLVPALCCPHHDQIQSNGVPRADDFDKMLLRNPGEVGICIDNNAAFVVEGNRWRALSTGPWEHADVGGGVQKKVFDNGKIVSTPLECGGDPKPLSDLLVPPDFTHLP